MAGNCSYHLRRPACVCGVSHAGCVDRKHRQAPRELGVGLRKRPLRLAPDQHLELGAAMRRMTREVPCQSSASTRASVRLRRESAIRFSARPLPCRRSDDSRRQVRHAAQMDRQAPSDESDPSSTYPSHALRRRLSPGHLARQALGIPPPCERRRRDAVPVDDQDAERSLLIEHHGSLLAKRPNERSSISPFHGSTSPRGRSSSMSSRRDAYPMCSPFDGGFVGLRTNDPRKSLRSLVWTRVFRQGTPECAFSY